MDAVRTIEPYTTSQGHARFKIRYRLGPKATSSTFKTEAGAREFNRLIDTVGVVEARRILDEREKAQDGTHTLAAYAHAHVDSLTGVGDGYRRRCHRMIDRDLTTLGPMPLTAITREAIARWVNALGKAKASGKTIKNKHGFLSAVLAHAVRDELIPSNPCTGTRLPRTIAPAMTFLTHDEYALFLDYFTPRWQPMITLMFSTGARFSELTALTVADVDIEAATLSITKAWKDNGKEIGPPKSKRSVRTLSLAPETIDVIKPLVEGRAGDALLLTNTLGDAVRLQTFHDNVWNPAVRLANGEPAAAGKRVGRRKDAAGKEIKPAKVGALLGKRPRPHDARHTCASWLLGAGVPINYVQAHLGHESITTTVDRYGHVMPAARLAIANAMSLALTQAHPRQIEGGAG
ncbi:MAG TPA: site-specific integrase [Cellulomonas sp.]